MSAEHEGLESGELRAVMDLKLGIRARKAWAKILVKGRDAGLTEIQIRGFVTAGGLFVVDVRRQEIAADLGFDWEGAASFFETIAPIIIEMMAACGA
jgi:hypothetical protein